MSGEFNTTFINSLLERISSLEQKTLDQQTDLDGTRLGVDTAWIANCTFLVFLMQCGFSLLEAGTARYKNYVSTLIKNVLDICFDTIAWWLVGYAFAFGDSRGRFIGASNFAAHNVDTTAEYNNWLFQWAFAGTSATIVSGVLLERVTILGYCIFSSFMTAWIYPLIVHWCWSENGWLKHMGYHDFAGSGVVHLCGGTAGLFATILIGSRIGRFSDKKNTTSDTNDKVEHISEESPVEFKSTNVPFVVLGTLLLWFSWYGFNCGSTITIAGSGATIVAKIGMNTSLAAASGGLTCLFFQYYYVKLTKKETDPDYEIYSVGQICNGLLSGLVGVTASCDVVAPWAAFVIGIISALIYIGYSELINYCKIDDPLAAVSIHGGAGSWGVVAAGWFHPDKGILYGHGGKLFGVNLLACVVIFAWTAVWTVAFFYLLRLFNLDRISKLDEDIGIDTKYCGGYAVHYDKVSRRHYSILFSEQNKRKSIIEINNIVHDELIKIKEHERAESEIQLNTKKDELNLNNVHGKDEKETKTKQEIQLVADNEDKK